MTNGEYIRAKLTDELLAELIHLIFCGEGRCEECMLRQGCNKTFDSIEKETGIAPNGKEVIKAMLLSDMD